MLAAAITAAIVGLASLVFGHIESVLGLKIFWHSISGVAGILASAFFLIWTCQRLA